MVKRRISMHGGIAPHDPLTSYPFVYPSFSKLAEVLHLKTLLLRTKLVDNDWHLGGDTYAA